MKSPAQAQNAIKSLLKKPDFLFIKKLAKAFPDCEIYLVGGAVRDHHLGRTDIKDYDFVVRNVPAPKLQKELKKMGWVDLVGKNFGVLKFKPTNSKEILEPFDIALPRTEKAWGKGGYKDVDVQSDYKLPLNEDLSRRDFTINAIALKVHPKFELIDEYNGLKDLKAKLIRTVGKPAERFQEDYSRLLRAVRFACQLDFKIEKETWNQVTKLMKNLGDLRQGGTERVVPFETIAKEMLKAFYNDPVKALDLYDESGAVKQLMPELLKMKGCPQPQNYHSEGDVWVHARLALKNLSSPGYKKLFGNDHPSSQIIMTTLFHDIAKPYTIKTPEKDGTDRIRFNEHDSIGGQMAKSICDRLKLSSPAGLGVDSDKMNWLISHHLLLVHANIDDIKNTTLEKYFFNANNPGQDLLKLFFVDGSATIPEKHGKPMLQDLFKLLKKLKELGKIVQRRAKPVEPILNGTQIMKEFKLKPGKIIGELLEALREQQLSKKVTTKSEAVNFLKKYLKSKK